VKADPRLAHLPVLIISGGGDQDDLVRCIEMGAVDYLPKPFNQAILRARIGSCLVQKRQRDRERQQLVPAGGRTGASFVLHSDTAEWNTTGPTRLKPRQGASASVDPSGPLPERLGRIAIRSFLGSGGMGIVYLGHHELLDLPVAVKLMRPELMAT